MTTEKKMSEPNHQILKIQPTGGAIESVHPVVARALASNPDPATLREILALQRDWEAGEARKAFDRALINLKRDLPSVITKDKVVDWTSKKTGERTLYQHATLAAVMDAVTDQLTQHGFTLSWETASEREQITVTCVLSHEMGHCRRTSLSAPIDRSGSKSPAQGAASTVTLLSRHTALSLLGIATRDHVDPQPSDDKPATDHVDPRRNLRAAAKLKDHGRSREEAEQYLGEPGKPKLVKDWTSSDIEALTQWLLDDGSREPGED